MTALDKTTLKTNLSTNYPDNTDNLIAPLNDRTQHTDEIDSALNIVNTALQTVLGTVNFTGTLQKNGSNVLNLANVLANQIVSVNAAGNDIEYAEADINPVSKEWTFNKKVNFPESPGLIYISSEADFAVQTGSDITLEADKIYFVVASFSTAKNFLCQNNVKITGFKFFSPVITFTGTGTMFSGTDVNFEATDITIDPGTAQGFDFTSTPGGTTIAAMKQLNMLNGSKFGTFNNIGILIIENATALNVDDGITLTGSSFNTATIDNTVFGSTSATCTFIDFGTAILQSISITRTTADGPTGSVGLSGLASSGNLPVGRIAGVTTFLTGANVTPLQGIANNDIRWDFDKCNAISDTRRAADAYLTGGTETVEIATQGVFVEIGVPGSGGVSWASDIEDHFTVSNDGVITYIGELPLEAQIIGRATVEKVGGGADEIEVRLAKNWVSPSSGLEKSRAVTQNATPTTVPISALVELVNGDDVRVIFTNNSSTSNILAEVTSIEVTG